MVCGNKGIHQGTEMGLTSHLMKMVVAAMKTAHLPLIWRQTQQDIEEGLMTSYIQDFNHLLEMYASHDFIAKTDNDIVRSTQQPGMCRLNSVKSLQMKTLF